MLQDSAIISRLRHFHLYDKENIEITLLPLRRLFVVTVFETSHSIVRISSKAATYKKRNKTKKLRGEERRKQMHE